MTAWQRDKTYDRSDRVEYRGYYWQPKFDGTLGIAPCEILWDCVGVANSTEAGVHRSHGFEPSIGPGHDKSQFPPLPERAKAGPYLTRALTSDGKMMKATT